MEKTMRKHIGLIVLAGMMAAAPAHAGGYAALSLASNSLEIDSEGSTFEFESEGISLQLAGRYVLEQGVMFQFDYNSHDFDEVCLGSDCLDVDATIDESQVRVGYMWQVDDASRPEWHVFLGHMSLDFEVEGESDDEDGIALGGGVRFFGGSGWSFPLELALYNLDDSDGASIELGVDYDVSEQFRLGVSIRGLSLEDEVDDEYSSGRFRATAALLF